MLQKYILTLLALIGIGLTGFVIYLGMKKPAEPEIIFQPPISPYQHYVAGQGTIESVFKNIFISPAFPELITDVCVCVGDIVEKGQPLFKLDTRQLLAQKETARTEIEIARSEFENARIQFCFYQQVNDTAAVSKKEYENAHYALKTARARLEKAQAQAKEIDVMLDRSTTRAPIDGEILQINIRVGEYANVNPYGQTPLIIFGDTSFYHLRIEIDEEDAWRVTPHARATAFVRGNAAIKIPLTYVYSEPYIIPKKQLLGIDEERIDTRVLQVVYAFEKASYPVYYGQLLDVFVETQPEQA